MTAAAQMQRADASARGWRSLGYGAAAATGIVLTWFYLVRVTLPMDPWAQWLSAAGVVDAPLPSAVATAAAVVLVTASLVALGLVMPAIDRALTSGRSAPLFLAASTLASLGGAGWAVASGPQLLGGTSMAAGMCGLAGISAAVALRVLLAERQGATASVRQWTLYAASLVFLPLTVIPTVPVWAWLASLSPGDAWITSTTVFFIGHLLVAHGVEFEVLGPASAR